MRLVAEGKGNVGNASAGGQGSTTGAWKTDDVGSFPLVRGFALGVKL